MCVRPRIFLLLLSSLSVASLPLQFATVVSCWLTLACSTLTSYYELKLALISGILTLCISYTVIALCPILIIRLFHINPLAVINWVDKGLTSLLNQLKACVNTFNLYLLKLLRYYSIVSASLTPHYLLSPWTLLHQSCRLTKCHTFIVASLSKLRWHVLRKHPFKFYMNMAPKSTAFQFMTWRKRRGHPINRILFLLSRWVR